MLITTDVNHYLFLILFRRSLESFRIKLNPPLSTSGRMLLRLLGKCSWGFCTDWLFSVSLKNSCNEKLLKVDVSEVGEIKIRAGKQGTHWNGFPENIIKFLSALSIPASKRPQLLTKHVWRHRRYQKLLFMYFKSFFFFFFFSI